MGGLLGSSPSSILERFVRAPIQSRLHARAVLVFGLSGVDGAWIWSDSSPWSCVVRRVWRSVLVSHLHTGYGSRRFGRRARLGVALRDGGTGYGSRRFGRRARLGVALPPVAPTYSRGLDSIVVIQYVHCSKAWHRFVLSLVSIYWNISCGERNYLRM